MAARPESLALAGVSPNASSCSYSHDSDASLRLSPFCGQDRLDVDSRWMIDSAGPRLSFSVHKIVQPTHFPAAMRIVASCMRELVRQLTKLTGQYPMHMRIYTYLSAPQSGSVIGTKILCQGVITGV
ncbi:hypothetical protein EJ05DRAFT_206021 [Pseudovirgaria hyperparasitica]|uniref:Uncharacterized protein n=1 Tax=Pseudovirgaria hyperparasitica TaxID=470096 RepID=A0A6A6WJH3_9PEZI|nr:uncharacterized protein EJ05DRAFT_206021 [Pseudovirgaria hyperparasitica]KAF2762330.1 hypothetical protein EJ05DRAFT_206021 [Pseudovirgaria hyperparasitica]